MAEEKEYLTGKEDDTLYSGTNDVVDIIIEKIKDIIEKNYPDRLTAEEIAAKINYSKKQTQRIFLKETGKTIYEYLTDFRIEKAKEMLRNGDLKVSLIAEYVGYKNATHFKELFEKYTGVSPADYRNANNK